jgi:hypothetical protein
MALTFPNVPIAPGVPPLARNPAAAAVTVVAVTADVISNLLALFAGPQWGVFDQNGNPVVTADNVVSLDFKSDWTISDYPVEQGGFQSYNKVIVPFESRVRFSTGGSVVDREELLASVEAIAGGTTLYNVVTPERIYINVNVTHYDYERAAMRGGGLLSVDLWLRQVQETVVTTFTSTKNPISQGEVSVGQVMAHPDSKGLASKYGSQVQ